MPHCVHHERACALAVTESPQLRFAIRGDLARQVRHHREEGHAVGTMACRACPRLEPAGRRQVGQDLVSIRSRLVSIRLGSYALATVAHAVEDALVIVGDEQSAIRQFEHIHRPAPGEGAIQPAVDEHFVARNVPASSKRMRLIR
jgi:cytochrome c2